MRGASHRSWSVHSNPYPTGPHSSPRATAKNNDRFPATSSHRSPADLLTPSLSLSFSHSVSLFYFGVSSGSQHFPPSFFLPLHHLFSVFPDSSFFFLCVIPRSMWFCLDCLQHHSGSCSDAALLCQLLTTCTVASSQVTQVTQVTQVPALGSRSFCFWHFSL